MLSRLLPRVSCLSVNKPVELGINGLRRNFLAASYSIKIQPFLSSKVFHNEAPILMDCTSKLQNYHKNFDSSNVSWKALSTATSTNKSIPKSLNVDMINSLSNPSNTQTAPRPLFGRKLNIKLKPRIVKQRLSNLKTYVANEKNIRHSPWRLNLVCQFVAGLPVKEALTQLQFCQKMKAPLVASVIERTARRADIKDGLKMSQLEISECFATHGHHLKRIKFMGRGRSGVKRRRHSHIRLVLRQIDFDLKILQAKTNGERRKWLAMKLIAEQEKAVAMAEREELLALEKTARKKKEKEEKNEN